MEQRGRTSGSVQQPATPSQPAAVSLPMGATPLDPPGNEALPLASGLPPGVIATGRTTEPLTAEQPSSWLAAVPPFAAPRPVPRPLPRLMPRPPPPPSAAADAYAGSCEGSTLYQGPDGTVSVLSDLDGLNTAVHPSAGFEGSQPAWFAPYSAQGQKMPGTLVTAGYSGVRQVDPADPRAARHVIRAGPSTSAPQRHALTPRVARPTGLLALEKLLRPSRAAELEAEQVRNTDDARIECYLTETFRFIPSSCSSASWWPHGPGLLEAILSASSLRCIGWPSWRTQALKLSTRMQAAIMDEAAAAARAAASAVPAANVMSAADDALTVATTTTARIVAPWGAEEDAAEGDFSSDLDIGMPVMVAPRSDGPAADEMTAAAAAQAGLAGGSAAVRFKGPSRRPLAAPASSEDALTLYRDLFDKAKCVASQSVGLARLPVPAFFCGREQQLRSGNHSAVTSPGQLERFRSHGATGRSPSMSFHVKANTGLARGYKVGVVSPHACLNSSLP